MGMYSELVYEDVEVKDFKGLKDFIDRFVEVTSKHLFHQSKAKAKAKAKAYYTKGLNCKEKTFTFYGTYGTTKLISYFYDEDILFFKGIAPFIEGTTEWIYETQDEKLRVDFRDGKVIFTYGSMVFEDITQRVNIKPTKLSFSNKKQHKIKNPKYKDYTKLLNEVQFVEGL